MAEEIEIQVRSLSGESTSISISRNKTILDLKLLLRNCFAPASATPNFHLFLKGVKLNLHSQISSHCSESGEFVVLAPFTKKNGQQTHKPNETAAKSNAQNQSLMSAFADSAWSAMMQDLSSLQNISSNNSQPDIEFETRPSGSKSGIGSDENEEKVEKMISNMLKSSENCVIDDKNCECLMQAMESKNCLSDPISKTCMLVKANSKHMDESTACLCPLWLKKIMKAFSFLNIYSVFLQLVRKKITLISMEVGLNRLNKFGFEIHLPDLENLSLLCPKVVHFVDNETEGKTLRNSLVIIKSQFQEEDQAEAKPKKGMNILKSINAMRKREISFQKNLWSAVKSLMNERGNEKVASYSLEDLLVHLKESSCSSSAKRPRGNSSASSSTSFESRCHDTNPLLPAEIVDHLRKGIGSQGQIVHVEEIGRRQAKYVEIPSELSEETKSALKHLGISSLYSHQAESIQATLASKHVVISTMTSSGKSLCYNLPVLEVLSHNLSACALYLFPTKALAQDQLRAILAMTKGLDTSLSIGIYDGDTCQEDRMWLRDNARLLITNPDMLHVSILPFHGQFSRFLTNLRFVVIDEAHAYKGAFGCHTALILRRLRRLCSHVYGSDPSFVFCTATSANPREHAMELANLSTIELIENDGSPSAPKHFVLWNPPLGLKTVPKKIKKSSGTETSAHNSVVVKRSSPILELSCLFAEIVQHGLRCIAFCKTRKLCELVLSYTREILEETAPSLADRICAYRAGYIAEDRRRIESEFFGGTLCGVAATNALELGIDVGHIDVTLHLGFPGSISSLWQQAGRSGRREKASLAIYVAFESPLDQYFMNFPHKLFSSPIECCHVDAKNQQVLEQHLACAAAEHPLSLIHDEKFFSHGLEISVMNLKGKGLLSTDPSRDSSARIWSYIGHEKKPSLGISIRAIEAEKYQVVDKQTNEVLEEIEESKAFFQIHDGAVYMHQGRTYLVKDLNLTTKIASCQRADLKYYTKTRDYTDIHIIGGKIAYPRRTSNDKISRTTAQANICKVTTTWFGFRRIWKGTNQVFDTVELSLPDYSYESKAVWIQVPQSVKTEVEIKDYSFRGGLHAACHALVNVVPLYIICNSSDLASECVNPYDNRFYPERILLYDPHPGGTGMSAQVQPIFTDLLAAALELLESCRCSGDAGCPKCVQNLSCQEYNEVLHKDAAILIIKGVLEAEKSYFTQMHQ